MNSSLPHTNTSEMMLQFPLLLFMRTETHIANEIVLWNSLWFPHQKHINTTNLIKLNMQFLSVYSLLRSFALIVTTGLVYPNLIGRNTIEPLSTEQNNLLYETVDDRNDTFIAT